MAAVLGLLAAIVYSCVPQETTHELDVYWMLPRFEAGVLGYPRHPLFFPVAHALAGLFEGFGTMHDRLKIVSAVASGVAIGFFVHAAWLLRRDLRSAVAAGMLYAALPATVRFATVMEVHGLFLAFAAAVLWQVSRMVSSPERVGWLAGPWTGGLCLGGLSSIASSVHASGHALVGVAATWLVVAWRERRAARTIAMTLLGVLVAHAVGVVVVSMLLSEDGLVAVSTAQIDAFAQHRVTLDDFPSTLSGEWLWPFFPVSILWVIGFVRSEKHLTRVLIVWLPVYLGVCQALLVLPDVGYLFRECGAYLMPLAFLAVVVVVDGLGERLRLLTFLVALSLSAWQWCHPAKPSPDRGFGVAAVEFLRAHDVRLVVGDFDEFDAAFDALHADVGSRSRSGDLLSVRQLVYEASIRGAGRAEFVALFFHPALAGRVSVLTVGAIEALRAAGGGFADAADRSLQAAYDMTEVRFTASNGRALAGWRLDPR